MEEYWTGLKNALKITAEKTCGTTKPANQRKERHGGGVMK
jgi:hypothetical protein